MGKHKPGKTKNTDRSRAATLREKAGEARKKRRAEAKKSDAHTQEVK